MAAQYRIAFRGSAWVECLIQRGAERWLGHGTSEDDALADAVARMLPSHLGRALLSHTLVAAPRREEVRRAPAVSAPTKLLDAPGDATTADAAGPRNVVVSRSARVAVVAASSDEPRNDVATGDAAEVAPADRATEIASAVAEDEAVPSPASHGAEASPSADETAAEAAEVEGPGADDATAAEAKTEPGAEAESSDAAEASAVTLDDAIVALDAIIEDIKVDLASFARLAPERQRLRVVIWIARARSFEEALPDEPEVARRADAIARRLDELTKMFESGAVQALKAGASPSACAELKVRWASAPKTWAEAASLADRVLERHLADARVDGRDADGWIEGPSEAPASTDPEKMFDDATAAIEAMAPPAPRPGKALAANQATLERLLRAARKLRWVRTRVQDGMAWGMAMGQLRRLLPAMKTRGKKIEHAIDPKARPEAPW